MSYNHLPEDFVPGDNDVVIGKGKKYFFHKGESGSSKGCLCFNCEILLIHLDGKPQAIKC
jgi:hypothetical protein